MGESARDRRLKKMAANEVRWLPQKTDGYKITVHDFLIHFMKISFQYVFKAVGNKERASYVKTTTISFQLNPSSSKCAAFYLCVRRDKYSFPTI